MLYLSGGMAGYEDNNRPAFRRVATLLERAGYAVIDLGAGGEHARWGRSDYMRRALLLLTGMADMVAVLDGWQESEGAHLEVEAATQLCIPVVPVAQLLEERGVSPEAVLR